MAKIGNEAKLILKLAEERAQVRIKAYDVEADSMDGQAVIKALQLRNKAAGLEEGLSILKSIFFEMES